MYILWRPIVLIDDYLMMLSDKPKGESVLDVTYSRPIYHYVYTIN